jgi:hypothetical protein
MCEVPGTGGQRQVDRWGVGLAPRGAFGAGALGGRFGPGRAGSRVAGIRPTGVDDLVAAGQQEKDHQRQHRDPQPHGHAGHQRHPVQHIRRAGGQARRSPGPASRCRPASSSSIDYSTRRREIHRTPGNRQRHLTENPELPLGFDSM